MVRLWQQLRGYFRQKFKALHFDCNSTLPVSRLSGAPARRPSAAMTRALQALSETDEMREFVAEAHARQKDVIVEVFQNRGGRPLLIHPNAVPQT
jgi:hypothetical protein